ncbi:MAG: hypothetical protein ACTSU0_11490 [Alphaproteobacteria bacterium]
MNHRHRKILQALFAHPVSGNISHRDVEHTLVELGAELSTRKGSRTSVTLNGHSTTFHHGGHSLITDEVVRLRNFLRAAGISPEDYAA